MKETITIFGISLTVEVTETWVNVEFDGEVRGFLRPDRPKIAAELFRFDHPLKWGTAALDAMNLVNGPADPFPFYRDLAAVNPFCTLEDLVVSVTIPGVFLAATAARPPDPEPEPVQQSWRDRPPLL